MSLVVASLCYNTKTSNAATDGEWIETQLKFRFGDWYDNMSARRLGNITKNYYPPSPLLTSEYQERVPGDKLNRSASSITVSFLQKRRIWWRDREFLECAAALCENLTDSTFFRTGFYDEILEADEFVIASNRPFNSSTVVLVPMHSYHNPSKFLGSANLSESFDLKSDILVWRGSTSGPIRPGSGRYGKNNRLDIVKRYYNSSNIDVGFGFVLDAFKEFAANFTKPRLSESVILRHKYILCLEGNDVATNFIIVLASMSCPFHTYPFTSESIYWGDGIHPWEHFVPVAVDGHDLDDKLSWCLKNEKNCRKIGENGHHYMKRYLDGNLYDAAFRKTIELLASQAF